MIYHLSGVCGTGKTEQLISNIEQIKNPETSTILWASLTNKLSEATCNRYKERYPEHNAAVISSENSSSVQTEILQRLESESSLTTQILFISHTALSMLTLDTLSQCTVIIDEIPTLIGNYQRLKIPLKDESILGLARYIDFEESSFDGFQHVVVKEEIRKKAKKFAYDLILNGDPNSDSVKAGKMLMGGIHNSNGLYVSTAGKWRLFEFFDGLEFISKLRQLDTVWLLSANLEGLFVEKLLQALNCSITTEHVLSHLNLPTTHPNTSNVEILPFLMNSSKEQSSSFSSYFASYQASKVIKDCSEEFDVHQLFNRWVSDLFKDQQFIYCKNKHTPPISCSNAIELPPMAQGLNGYSHLNEVAFMPHLRPAPEHKAAIKRLAKDIEISQQSLVDSYLKQTSYEAAYQFVSRISFRNLNRDENGSLAQEQTQPSCKIVVPDMAHAEYIQRMMPTASINTSSSYQRVPTQASTEEIAQRQTKKAARKAIRDAEKQKHVFDTLFIIHQQLKGGRTAKSACETMGITPKTRRNWLKHYGEDWTTWLAEQELSKELERGKGIIIDTMTN
ncbi:hypothetical protein VB602_14085 [Vibrio parahaemolyticus]|uniref:hypothetical protein n=1 Tax=Vibrio harveyi group TaxID=717610 RepID=UPI0007A041A7|nr:hypothetical protein [Vibrio parahaemolyticus]EGQ9350812.1 hypothetical protein [Vibrio parahaemolyticus]EGQ9513236.1 hypothetical protein [Vibrio parahaemolyticus]EIM7930732.1 hypothetical protein [Vibrio parahaemolyticus]EJC1445961.1 hypothetical protein [Vibrio parahaemolyticus]EJQ8016836.1 hypothetical protein [Vibrio parahaemolyticus]